MQFPLFGIIVNSCQQCFPFICRVLEGWGPSRIPQFVSQPTGDRLRSDFPRELCARWEVNALVSLPARRCLLFNTSFEGRIPETRQPRDGRDVTTQHQFVE
ncbi:hypothetical protein QQF64_033104 [Cirrhinus molitorella]|uniref:Uncharacterized protein n=1 Tax=Cirrhinus molitorella TaxID=172907 RepID=A0ABR3MT07_9TELE